MKCLKLDIVPKTEVHLSKATNPRSLPRRHSENGCPLLYVCLYGVCAHYCVCVCTRMGENQRTNYEYVTPYLAKCHFHKINIYRIYHI